MGQFYYLTPQNEQRGPVDASQLSTYGVNANTMVWTEGMPQWAPASKVPELRPFLAPAVPQPAPPPTPQPAPQPVSQPAPQPAYAAPQQSAPQTATQKPGNNMALAVLTTVLCCLPLGIVSIVYAQKVDGLYFAGDYAGALEASKNARKWAIIGMITGIAVGILYFLIYGITALTAMNVFD